MRVIWDERNDESNERRVQYISNDKRLFVYFYCWLCLLSQFVLMMLNFENYSTEGKKPCLAIGLLQVYRVQYNIWCINWEVQKQLSILWQRCMHTVNTCGLWGRLCISGSMWQKLNKNRNVNVLTFGARVRITLKFMRVNHENWHYFNPFEKTQETLWFIVNMFLIFFSLNESEILLGHKNF